MAALIDLIPIAIAATLVAIQLGGGFSCTGAPGMVRCSGVAGLEGLWLALGGLSAYWIVCWCLLGGSLGQRALALRVVDARRGTPIGPLRAVARMVALLLVAVPVGVGLLWCAVDGEKRAWHDRLAGTAVVRQH